MGSIILTVAGLERAEKRFHLRPSVLVFQYGQHHPDCSWLEELRRRFHLRPSVLVFQYGQHHPDCSWVGRADHLFLCLTVAGLEELRRRFHLRPSVLVFQYGQHHPDCSWLGGAEKKVPSETICSCLSVWAASS